MIEKDASSSHSFAERSSQAGGGGGGETASSAATAAAAAGGQAGGANVIPPPIVYNEDTIHKVILVGDSGVGKTSLLVQFDQGKFQSGSFSATVGIGFTVSVFLHAFLSLFIHMKPSHLFLLFVLF